MLALPVLESIAPFGAKAMGAKSTLPVRLLFYYVPNGMHMQRSHRFIGSQLCIARNPNAAGEC